MAVAVLRCRRAGRDGVGRHGNLGTRLAVPEAGKTVTQLAALLRPEILAMMAITITGFGASFAAFTFITPILTDISGFHRKPRVYC